MYRHRRDEIFSKMGAGVMILPGQTEQGSHGLGTFRQLSDFFYVTGINEPDCLALLSTVHPEHHFSLVVPPFDREIEKWVGQRISIETAPRDYGADAAYPQGEFSQRLREYLVNCDVVYYALGQNEELDREVLRAIRDVRAMERKNIRIPEAIIHPGTIIHEMRLRKSPSEMSTLRQAAEITTAGFVAALPKIRPGMFEYEIAAELEYHYKTGGATGIPFPTIVASGNNGVILHYRANRDRIRPDTLITIDSGAEYQGYACDVSRTVPASGRFTPAQRDLYQLVLATQQAAIDLVRPGIRLDDIHLEVLRLFALGLRDLGLLTGSLDEIMAKKEVERFYTHRTSHFVGLDVHDSARYYQTGQSRFLEAGLCLTIEPGLYIPAGLETVPERFWNTGIRIEDTIIVTEQGSEVLSRAIPKEIDATLNLITPK
jgi:Xaa-Pro aminopeptidase